MYGFATLSCAVYYCTNAAAGKWISCKWFFHFFLRCISLTAYYCHFLVVDWLHVVCHLLTLQNAWNLISTEYQNISFYSFVEWCLRAYEWQQYHLCHLYRTDAPNDINYAQCWSILNEICLISWCSMITFVRVL